MQKLRVLWNKKSCVSKVALQNFSDTMPLVCLNIWLHKIHARQGLHFQLFLYHIHMNIFLSLGNICKIYHIHVSFYLNLTSYLIPKIWDSGWTLWLDFFYWDRWIYHEQMKLKLHVFLGRPLCMVLERTIAMCTYIHAGL